MQMLDKGPDGVLRNLVVCFGCSVAFTSLDGTIQVWTIVGEDVAELTWHRRCHERHLARRRATLSLTAR